MRRFTVLGGSMNDVAIFPPRHSLSTPKNEEKVPRIDDHTAHGDDGWFKKPDIRNHVEECKHIWFPVPIFEVYSE